MHEPRLVCWGYVAGVDGLDLVPQLTHAIVFRDVAVPPRRANRESKVIVRYAWGAVEGSGVRHGFGFLHPRVLCR